MNVTIEHPSEASVPTLDLPSAPPTGRPTAVGIQLRHQPLKQPLRPSSQSRVTPEFLRKMTPTAPLPRIPPPAAAAPPPPPKEVMQTFTEFANPSKQRAGPPSNNGSELSFGGNSDYSDRSGGSTGSDASGEDDQEYDDVVGDYPARGDEPATPIDDPLRPSEGFKTLDEEKTDILCKLNRLKRQGFSGLRSFGVHSDIREMRAELNRVKSELELEASIKFQRKILIALTSTLEYGNKRWNPLDLELNGWSEQVVESITDYDNVFERLHQKYKGKMSMPPEMELVTMVASSAFVFHLTNTMFKNKSVMENPAFMEKMAQAMAQQAAKQQQQQQNTDQEDAGPQQPSEPRDYRHDDGAGPSESGGGRREIRGPGGMDFSSFLGGALPPIGFGPPPPRPASAQIQPTPQPRSPPKKKRPAPSVSSESGSERLSDIISEDLASIPDDLSDISEKVVTVQQAPAKKRGKKDTTSKNVIML